MIEPLVRGSSEYLESLVHEPLVEEPNTLESLVIEPLVEETEFSRSLPRSESLPIEPTTLDRPAGEIGAVESFVAQPVRGPALGARTSGHRADDRRGPERRAISTRTPRR